MDTFTCYLVAHDLYDAALGRWLELRRDTDSSPPERDYATVALDILRAAMNTAARAHRRQR